MRCRVAICLSTAPEHASDLGARDTVPRALPQAFLARLGFIHVAASHARSITALLAAADASVLMEFSMASNWSLEADGDSTFLANSRSCTFHVGGWLIG
jgi:hypothetical protein